MIKPDVSGAPRSCLNQSLGSWCVHLLGLIQLKIQDTERAPAITLAAYILADASKCSHGHTAPVSLSSLLNSLSSQHKKLSSSQSSPGVLPLIWISR